jgi:hypothetical protein
VLPAESDMRRHPCVEAALRSRALAQCGPQRFLRRKRSRGRFWIDVLDEFELLSAAGPLRDVSRD